MAEPEIKKPEGQPEGQQAPPPEGENAAIRQMRAEIERSQQEAREAREQMKVLEARAKERQRAEMGEAERLRAELEEVRQVAAQAEQHRDELGRWQTWAQRDYDAELAKIEDGEIRAEMKRMTSSGDWRERLESLKGARAMHTRMERAQREAERAKAELEKAQSSYGTRTQPAGRPPGGPAPPPPAAPAAFDRNKIPSWGAVLQPVKKYGRQRDETE